MFRNCLLLFIVTLFVLTINPKLVFANVSKEDISRIPFDTGFAMIIDVKGYQAVAKNTESDLMVLKDYSLVFDNSLRTWSLVDENSQKSKQSVNYGNQIILGVVFKDKQAIKTEVLGEQSIENIDTLEESKKFGSTLGRTLFDKMVYKFVDSYRDELASANLSATDLKTTILYTADFDNAYDDLNNPKQDDDSGVSDFVKLQEYKQILSFLEPLVQPEKEKLDLVEEKFNKALPSNKNMEDCSFDYTEDGKSLRDMHNECFIKLTNDKTKLNILDALNSIYDKQYTKVLFIENTITETKEKLNNIKKNQLNKDLPINNQLDVSE